MTNRIYNILKSLSFRAKNPTRAGANHAAKTAVNPHNPTQSPRINERRNERGNVFFTLFGAVAIVGVLGAGIMSTMRGPLSTMVEVNRREQAKAELRLASSLLLVNSGDTCSDSDGYTEGPDPTGSGPTGGGVLPSVGAPQNDPWGNPYGYCAWDHGNSAGTSGGCGSNILAGNTSTNNIAIAVMSAGPDGIFQTTCEDDNTGTNDYVEPDAGAEDDIVVAITYNQAISGSGGLWSIKDSEPGTAEIDKDVDLTRATGDFSGASPQLRLGAASMLLPDQSALATCNASNDQLLRRDTSTGRTLIQVCDDTGGNGWVNLTSPWSINGDDIYMASTATQLGIGTATPNDTLDVVGTFGLTGAAALGGTLDVTGATTLTTLTTSGLATLESLTVTNAATFNGSVTFSQPLVGDVTITGSNADNSSDALTVQNSASSVIMVAQNDGTVGIGKSDPTEKLDVDGNITASGTIMLDGTTILDNENDTSNILLGNTASNNPGTTTDYMNLGDAIHADLANKRVGIGFADSYDVSNFDSTLEVNGGADFTGGIDVDGASDIDTLTISGTGTALTVNNAADIDTLNVTGSGDALTVTNGVDIGGDVDVDGSLEADDYTYQGTTFIPTSCASNEKLDFESGAWVCESYDDEDGSGAAGDRNLQEVLADGNDANNQSMINISGIAVGSSTLSGSLVVDVTGNVGATNYCDNAGNNCFAPNDVGDLGTTIGNLAIDDLTDGATNATYGNLFLGHEGGSFGANNTYNTAVGYNALNSLDNDATLGAGDSNTAFGYNALSSNTTGSGNTAFGTNALFYNATGSNNVVMGEDAALGADSSTVINNSVILGHTAGSAITTADNNILIGYQAGDVITEGDNNIIIGYDVDPSSATASNELNIGNTIFGDLSTGYVGIGTNAPANTFHVESSSDYAAQIVGNNASWLTIRRPGFADNIGLLLGVDSSNKTIVGSNNATPLYFLTNSLTRIAIEATSGRVGIGTSSPEATLDVVGTDAMILPRGTTAQQPAGGVSVNGMIRYDTDVDKFQAFQAGAWQDILTSATSGGSSVSLVDVDNDTKIEVDTAFDGSANTTVFTNNSAETMRITATGELGIGTDTPDTLLHAESDSSSADSVTSVLRLTSTNDGTGTIAAGIGAGMEFEIETATDNFELGAVIEAVTTDVTDTSEDVDLVFKTMAAGATADEAMRIKNTGSVEVTSPTNAFLDLINDNNNNATTNYSAFRVINNGPFGTGTAKAFFGYDESNDVVKISRGAIGYNDFVIDSTGDVGIGTSTISDGSGSGGQALKLDVEGPIGGTYYCDEDGLNCFTAADVGSVSDIDWDSIVDAMTLDASTDINAPSGQAYELSITNKGTGNSFTVNDEAADTTPFVIDTTGKVGIGTISPQRPLHVVDNTSSNMPAARFEYANGTGAIEIKGNILSASEVRFGDSNSLFLGRISYSNSSNALNSNSMNFYTGTTQKMIINSSGSIGIGTTSPSDGSGSGGQALKLDVEGPIGGTYYCDEDGLNCFTAASVGSVSNIDWDSIVDAMTLDASTDINAPSGQAYELSITNEGTGNSFIVNDEAADTTPFVIDAAGNVGIGTDSPTQALDINITGANLKIGANGSGSPSIYLREYEVMTTYQSRPRFPSGMYVGTANVVDYSYLININGSNSVDGIVGRNNGTYNLLSMDGGAMNIDSLGNAYFIGDVGVGTNTPDVKLHAESDSSSADSVTSVLRLTSTNDGTGTIAAGIGAGMEFEIETATDNNEVGAVIEAVTTDVTATSEDVDLVFKTMAAGAAASEAMRITSNNKIGIGTTTPSDGSGSGGQALKLDVEGPIGGTYYCDEDGLNCFTAADVGSVSDIDWDSIVDAMTLDASTDINAPSGQAYELSITNEGTGNSFIVNDEAADTSPFVIDASGNIGAGTATPSTNFHLYSNNIGYDGSLYRQLKLDNSDASSSELNAGTIASIGAYIGFESAYQNSLNYSSTKTTAGGIKYESGRIDFYNDSGLTVSTPYNPTERLSIASTGNIGIGTTSPSDGSGSGGQALKLDVAGAIGGTYYCDEDGLNCFQAADVAAAGTNIDWDSIVDSMTLDASTDINAPSGQAYEFSITNEGTGNSFIVNDEDSDTTPFVIDASGNVGIGTTSPLYDLHIDNPDITEPGIFIQDPSADATYGGRIFYDNDIDGLVISTIGANTETGNITLSRTSGRIGIGIHSPSTILHIKESSGTGMGDWGSIDVSGATATFQDGESHKIYIDGDSIVANAAMQLGTTTAADLKFGTNGTETMRIKSGGTVGVGTSTTSTGDQTLKLDVEGPIGGTYYCDEDGNNCFQASDVAGLGGGAIDWDDIVDVMTLDASTDINAPSGQAYELSITNEGTGNSFIVNDEDSDTTPFVIDADGYVGIGNTSPDVALDVTGDIEYTGTITDVSDRRLKDNIKPLEQYGDLLDKIDRVDTYSFTMKDDEKGRIEFGVMAQELEDIFPELVHTAADDMGTKSVNYIGLIAPMIEATKALKAENDALHADIQAMTAAQQEVKASLASLDEQVALLNKAAGNRVNKASWAPSQTALLWLLLGLLGGAGIMVAFARNTRF